MNSNEMHTDIVDHLTWCLESKSVPRKESADAVAAYRRRPTHELTEYLGQLELEQADDEDLLKVVDGARAVLSGQLTLDRWLVMSWQYQGLM